MAISTISDLDILKTILQLQDEGINPTVRQIGARIGMTGAGVSRRLHKLEREGLVGLGPTRLLPGALDHAVDHLPQSWASVAWSVRRGQLLLTAWPG